MLKVRKMICVAVVVLLAAGGSAVWAQQGPGDGGGGPGGGGPGDGGPGGPPNPDRMREMMVERVQAEMGASDDEFQSLEPKIEQLIQLQRDASVRPLRPGGGPGGPGGPDGQGGPGDQGGGGGGGQGMGGGGGGGDDGPPRPPASAVQTAADALHTTLADKNATAADIQTKVDALRAARAKAKADLAEAQASIQKVLTPKQVAALVELGLLE